MELKNSAALTWTLLQLIDFNDFMCAAKLRRQQPKRCLHFFIYFFCKKSSVFVKQKEPKLNILNVQFSPHQASGGGYKRKPTELFHHFNKRPFSSSTTDVKSITAQKMWKLLGNAGPGEDAVVLCSRLSLRLLGWCFWGFRFYSHLTPWLLLCTVVEVKSMLPTQCQFFW